MQIDVHNPRWMADAACKGTPLDVWYTPDDRTGRAGDEHNARALCLNCPVIGECATWINRIEDRASSRKHGIWAGLTATERWLHQDTIRDLEPHQYEPWYRATIHISRRVARLAALNPSSRGS